MLGLILGCFALSISLWLMNGNLDKEQEARIIAQKDLKDCQARNAFLESSVQKTNTKIDQMKKDAEEKQRAFDQKIVELKPVVEQKEKKARMIIEVPVTSDECSDFKKVMLTARAGARIDESYR